MIPIPAWYVLAWKLTRKVKIFKYRLTVIGSITFGMYGPGVGARSRQNCYILPGAWIAGIFYSAPVLERGREINPLMLKSKPELSDIPQLMHVAVCDQGGGINEILATPTVRVCHFPWCQFLHLLQRWRRLYLSVLKPQGKASVASICPALLIRPLSNYLSFEHCICSDFYRSQTTRQRFRLKISRA